MDEKPAAGCCSRSALRPVMAVRKSGLVSVSAPGGGCGGKSYQGQQDRGKDAAWKQWRLMGTWGLVGLWGCTYVARARASSRHQLRASQKAPLYIYKFGRYWASMWVRRGTRIATRQLRVALGNGPCLLNSAAIAIFAIISRHAPSY